MFERSRLHPTVALTLTFLSLLAPAQLRAGSGQPAVDSHKHADYGTVTFGASAAGSPAKPSAVDATAAGADRKPGLAGVASVTTTGTIVNVAVSTASGNQQAAVMLADGNGGAMVVWQDQRGADWDVYAQRLSVDGMVAWVQDGVRLSKAVGDQTNPRAVTDGVGGVIVVWQDSRSGPLDLYAQRLTGSGVEAWATGGVLVSGALGDQKQPVVVSDGQGGAVVAWVDERAGGSDVYVQRISAGGVAQWTADGVALCTASGVQRNPTIVTDGQRGAIVGWQDERGAAGDIYVRRVDEMGAPQWTADGVVMCGATGTQETPVAVTDGAGGAILAWVDGRGANKDVYVRRVNNAGAPQWTADGVVVCGAGGDQVTPVLSEDGAGGVVVTWQDGRGANQDVYVQRVNNAGAAQWAGNGVGLCTAVGDQTVPAIAGDPLGGAVVAWSDLRTGGNGTDIFAQHVNLAGAVQWTANGVQVCDALNPQDGATVASDGQGGAFSAWRDLRTVTFSDVYSQRIDDAGVIAGQCAATTLLAESTPATATVAQNHYTFDQSQFYWTGVGVRGAAGSDWDMETYEPVTFGNNPYPVCFSGSLAGSFGSSGVDFVVGDFNIGHTFPVVPNDQAGYGVRAFRYSGAGNGTVEWDSNADVMDKDCGTGGACGAKSGNNWTGVIDVYDLFLLGNTTYTFTFARTGSADIKLLLFGSNGTTGTYFVPRSARLFETTSPTWVFTAADTEWYAVVLVNDNGLAGTYTVRAVTGVPTSNVGETPGSLTGLRGVSPNPSAGRVQIQFALHEPGAVAFDVVDMAGRMVARIPGRHWEAGAWSVEWDGRTSRGTQAAPGIYFVQMRVDERRVGLGRLALIR
jgi:hypothetical protein